MIQCIAIYINNFTIFEGYIFYEDDISSLFVYHPSDSSARVPHSKIAFIC